ncbi:MAG TPA: twin-arginine translocation signal domain-containing protein, partial [Verrucomicrobiae bacterium]|nr:twin-arginine translocation signal domain-containing protein [Verrucomicrobiae bacterium]
MSKKKQRGRELTRRKFLGATSTTVATVTILPRHAMGGPQSVPSGEKANVAFADIFEDTATFLR